MQRLSKPWMLPSCQHQLGTKTLYSSFDCRHLDIVFGRLNSHRYVAIQCLVEIHDHHGTRFNRNPKHCNIADPDGYAEDAAKEPLQEKAPLMA